MKSVALITGGASGIGLGISKALAAADFDLVVSGRRAESEVAEALGELRETAEVCYVSADVASTADRERLLATAREHFGRLHCLVNNAGVAPSVRADLLEATEESYERVMGINLRGPYFLTQSAANWMVEQLKGKGGKSEEGGGETVGSNTVFSIINVGSISATVASPSRGDYCLSKAAMRMMTALFAVRLADEGVSVFEIQPGLTLSGMTGPVKEKYDALIEDGLPLQRRWGTPEDNGKAVVALATGAFPYSTGAVIPVDGGLMVSRL